jgi:hypothetical protein
MEVYILKKSNRKGKRYMIIMSDKMTHHFGSDVGSTFIDHKDEKKKKAWFARHRLDKNFYNKHSGIYHSRKLLWDEPTLKEAIKKYEKEHKVKIKNEI